MLTDDEVRARYGANAMISRTGDFVLVHLDAPDADRMRRRTEAFDPETWFHADCPLCQLQRARGVFVFDVGPPDENDEWLFLD